MDSWSNPAYRPSQGPIMTTARRRDSNPRSDPELLTRTSWVNAALAHRQVKRGRADGNTCSLWLRAHLQRHLYSLGCFLQLHCGKVLFLGLLLLSLCCVGLKTARMETKVEELWVEDGGRLEQELEYTKKILGEGSGTTYEILIQTPKNSKNLLNIESVLLHFNSLLEATKVQVEIDGISWKFRDICYAANFPIIENEIIDHILDGLLPCVIITPIDCFWEGSLLLGPEYGVETGSIANIPEYLTWANLNPKHIVDLLINAVDSKGSSSSELSDLGMLLGEIMNSSGIGTAYQEKPCLNPYNQDCPDTAPNKHTKQLPDLGALFTDGCQGFSTKYMNWHEDLLFGGILKNKTGHISRVEAYQSVLQLMGEQDLYDYYKDHVKTSATRWNLDSAKTVLEAWQRKFSSVLNSLGNSTTRDNVYAFSYTSLMDIMHDFSSISVTRVVIGYILMFIYACISLMRWNDAVNSQSGVGMAGVLLVSLSVAAGLGMCSVLGIAFNASTTQIIPFLALGLGVDDMFLLAHTYSETSRHVPYLELSGEVLKRTGVTVLLSSVTNMLAFFTAAIIPIPALRAFSLQAGVLVLFNIGSVLTVFPAIVSLDLVRRDNNRIDVLCCFQSAGPSNQVLELQPHSREAIVESQHDILPPPSYSPPPAYTSIPMHQTVAHTTPDGNGAMTTLAPSEGIFIRRNRESPSGCPSTTSSQQCLTPDDTLSCAEHCIRARKECQTLSLTCLALRLYSFLLEHTFVRVMVIVTFLVLLVVGAWGVAQMQDGLDLTDVVPRDTTEYSFLEAQAKYFGFYSIYAVTKSNFDYPNNQKLLHEYYDAFQQVDHITKHHDGSSSTFWLQIFRQWLQDLQNAFDHDVAAGNIRLSTWERNASDEGILAYKLLAQTGDADLDHAVDRKQVMRVRLVNEQGIINPRAFYNYLTAWRTNDAMAYAASMANIHPLSKDWTHIPEDNDFAIPKSQALEYAQISFYLTNLSQTEDIIKTVTEIRSICERFSDRGLPNYPSGVPFTYWEQYINLRFYLMLALICVLATTFLVLAIALMSLWLATILVVVLAMMLVELFGLMGIIGIKLSAVPAVILVMTVGIGMEFTLHIGVGFVTAIGNRDRRALMATEHTFAPVVHGAVSTFLGIIMLVSTEFDFITKYFFNVLAAMVVIGILNGLFLLPVLLSILGPPGEVIPKDNPDRLSTPTPEPSPQLPPRPSRIRRIIPRVNSDISLSTITEEPTQYSSHEIIVQPEVVVETTTVPNGSHGAGAGNDDTISDGSSDGSRNSIQISTINGSQSTHITRVKATATVKVEVHTPIPGAVNQEHTYKSKRRKARQLKEQDSTASDSEC